MCDVIPYEQSHRIMSYLGMSGGTGRNINLLLKDLLEKKHQYSR